MRTPAARRLVTGAGVLRRPLLRRQAPTRRSALLAPAVMLLCPVLALVLTACAPAPATRLARPAGPVIVIPERPVAPPPPRSFTLLASGDVLLHTSLWDQAASDAAVTGRGPYDFGPIFASVRPVVSAADLAICHMETPLGEPTGPFSSYPIFSVPPQVATTIAEIGYDSCSTASNHSIDRGVTGLVRTLDTLDAAGLRHTGTARSEVERVTPTLLRAGGVTIGQLSYTFSFNGLRLPRDMPWLANPIDIDAILFDARQARVAGAEVVVVSLHFGTEYNHTPNSYQLNLVRRLVESPDVDLILGHHAHVVQPLEKIGDKWVVYGMGNQVSNQTRSLDTRDGIMPRFTFTEVSPGVFRVTRVEVIPVYMYLEGPKRLYDISSVLASPDAAQYLRDSCLASLARTRAVLGQRGAYEDGLILVGDPAAP